MWTDNTCGSLTKCNARHCPNICHWHNCWQTSHQDIQQCWLCPSMTSNFLLKNDEHTWPVGRTSTANIVRLFVLESPVCPKPNLTDLLHPTLDVPFDLFFGTSEWCTITRGAVDVTRCVLTLLFSFSFFEWSMQILFRNVICIVIETFTPFASINNCPLVNERSNRRCNFCEPSTSTVLRKWHAFYWRGFMPPKRVSKRHQQPTHHVDWWMACCF